MRPHKIRLGVRGRHLGQRMGLLARAHIGWTTFFSLAGILGIAALLIILFSPSYAEYDFLKSTQALSPGSNDFVEALATMTHGKVARGDAPEILNNGDEFIPSLVSAINGAKHTIDITDYIWTAGQFSDEIFPALLNAQKRGVSVRILPDADGSAMPKDYVGRLRALGGEVIPFRPIDLLDLNVLYKRDHRRLVDIDGTTAYTGGIAFDDLWLGDGVTHGKWRDMMFLVRGTVAQDLQGAFSDIWKEATGEVIAGPGFYPYPPAASATGSATYVEIFSAPTGYFQPVRDAFLLSILSARKSIYIENLFLLPDAQTMQALEDKAREGVDVRLLVTGADSGSQEVRLAGQTNYDALLKAGAKIYEYDTPLHAKTMAVDGAWSLVGSANFDSRSSALNDEDVLGVSDPAFAQELQSAFLNDATRAQEMNLDSWEKRPFRSTLLSWASSLFAKEY